MSNSADPFISYSVLFMLAMGFLQAIIIMYLKNNRADHTKISNEVSNLKSEVATLKANRMTDRKVKEIMHDQIEPVIQTLDKMQSNQERSFQEFRHEIKNISENVVIGLKEEIINLSASQRVLKEQLSLQNGYKKDAQ